MLLTGSVKMILLLLVGTLAFLCLSSAEVDIHPEGPVQCLTDVEKIYRMKCQLQMKQNKLDELEAVLEEVKEAIQCGTPPPSHVNGSSSHSGTRFNDKARYSCNYGYELKGNQVIKCEVTGEWGQAPSCKRVECGIPAAIAGGKSRYSGIYFEDETTYECHDGYILEGPQSVKCDINGNWGPTPKCTKRDCGVPPKIQGSNSSHTGVKFGDTVEYECQRGYVLEGQKVVKCEHTGHWGETPTCIASDCEPLLPVWRGNFSLSTGDSGVKARYSCENGYNLEGNQVIQCGATGQWDLAPCCRKVTTGLTLTEVNWRWDRLTDTDLTGRLQSLSGHVRKLDMYNNKLTQIPALGEYTQLDTLEWLSLSHNEIVSFEWDQIPTSITYLDLALNKLSMLPVVGEAHRCLSVRELRVYGNNLQTLEARQLPVSLTVLYVSHNKLSSVPDLSSLPLTVLYIRDNLLTDINVDNLPVSLTKLDLSINNLTQVPDLSHLPLTWLMLSYNPLTELNGHKLPVTLSELYLYGDRVTVSGVSHLINLSEVVVSNDNIEYYSEKFQQADVY